MKYKKGVVLFAETSSDNTAINNAKNYILKNGFTHDQVKIVKNTHQEYVNVVVK